MQGLRGSQGFGSILDFELVPVLVLLMLLSWLIYCLSLKQLGPTHLDAAILAPLLPISEAARIQFGAILGSLIPKSSVGSAAALALIAS